MLENTQIMSPTVDNKSSFGYRGNKDCYLCRKNRETWISNGTPINLIISFSDMWFVMR